MSQSKRRAIYPGSFDPITLGHIDIIRRMAGVFDEVVVLVADSLKKQYFFNQDERTDLIRESLRDLPNIRVDQFHGLTIKYALENDIDVIIRSLRGSGDWDLESTMAQANKKLAGKIETFFIMTEAEYAHISSTLVKEIAFNGGDLKEFVSPVVAKAIEKKIARNS